MAKIKEQAKILCMNYDKVYIKTFLTKKRADKFSLKIPMGEVRPLGDYFAVYGLKYPQVRD